MSGFGNISKSDIKIAAEVADFMMNCSNIDRDRYDKAIHEGGLPHGDLAYAQALIHWRKNGKPRDAWFSYEPGQIECKLLIAFRNEIGSHFGLEIMTTEEGDLRRRLRQEYGRLKTKKVIDWLN